MTNKKHTFAEAYARLEEITAWFQRDDIDLEEALTKFEEGMKLVGELKHQLASFENRVTDIKQQMKKT